MIRQQSGASAAGALDERLRRRGRGADGEDDVDEDGIDPGALLAPSTAGPSPMRPPLFRSATERRERSESAGAGLQDLKDWHRRSLVWKDQLLGKLKRVASQPALAAAGSSSMVQAAEAAIASARGGAAAPAGASVAQQVQALAYAAANQRPKDGGKAD